MRRTNLVATLLVLLTVSPAVADVYLLSLDGCTGTCGGPLPYGSVTVTSAGTDTVHINVELFGTNRFLRTGFDGTFGFNLSGITAIAITGLGAPWVPVNLTADSEHFNGFGFFDYAIELCVPGKKGKCSQGGAGFAGPLDFYVTAAGLTVASFQKQSTGGASFVADIVSASSATGAVGGNLMSVPEPSALVLFGCMAAFVGLIGSGWFAKAVLLKRYLARSDSRR